MRITDMDFRELEDPTKFRKVNANEARKLIQEKEKLYVGIGRNVYNIFDYADLEVQLHYEQEKVFNQPLKLYIEVQQKSDKEVISLGRLLKTIPAPAKSAKLSKMKKEEVEEYLKEGIPVIGRYHNKYYSFETSQDWSKLKECKEFSEFVFYIS